MKDTLRPNEAGVGDCEVAMRSESPSAAHLRSYSYSENTFSTKLIILQDTSEEFLICRSSRTSLAHNLSIRHRISTPKSVTSGLALLQLSQHDCNATTTICDRQRHMGFFLCENNIVELTFLGV